MTTQSAATVPQRVSRLEGAYEQVNERLGDIDRRLESLRAETNQRFNEMNQRFNVHLVLIGGLWATTIGGFAALATLILRL